VLTLPEDLLLLMSGDNGGRDIGVSRQALSAGFVAAALMELAIRNRIDSDLEGVWVTDDSPIGEAGIDVVLTQLSADRLNFEATELMERLTSFGQTIRNAALTRLQDRGILKIKEGLFSRILGSEHYSIMDQSPIDDLKAELAHVLLSDDIPSPREVCLLSLANTLALTDQIVPNANLALIELRLATLAKMDLIGRSMGGCLDLMFQKLAVAYLSFPRC
jgi:golgi phosphoprotein 3